MRNIFKKDSRYSKIKKFFKRGIYTFKNSISNFQHNAKLRKLFLKIKNKKIKRLMIRTAYGYNLITLSMVVLIMGVIMTALIGYYDALNINRRTTMTEDKFKIINTSLVAYLAKNGKFPCPAPLDCDLEGCNNDSVFTEKVLGIEFRQDRDIDNDCIADNSGVFESKNEKGEKILYGNIPALSLGLDNNYLIDSWQNKIVYIIPDILTKDNSLKNILLNKDARDPTISDEYVKDGEIFLLLSNNVNTSGAFPYENRESNDFSSLISSSHNEDKYNLPQKDFTIDLENAKQLKFHTNIDNLHDAFNSDDGNGEIPIAQPDCEATTYDIQIEVVSTEEIPTVYEKGDSIPKGKKVGDVIKPNDTIKYAYNKGRVISLVIPKAVTSIYVDLYGAQGGHSPKNAGGYGGRSYGILNTTDEFLKNKLKVHNRTLYLWVGGRGPIKNDVTGGWPDGGKVKSDEKEEGGGGGSSSITTSNKYPTSSSNDNRIIIAGGGGGASTGGTVTGGNGDIEYGGHGCGGNSNGINGFGKYKKKALGGCAKGNKSNCNNVFSTNRNDYHGGGGYRVGKNMNGDHAGQGGGSGYIDTNLFTQSGGSCKAWGYGRSQNRNGRNGQIDIKYLTVSGNVNISSETYTYTIKFPKAQYGEKVDSINECPKVVGGSLTNPDEEHPQKLDYYTLSSNRDINGNLINNRLRRECGLNGKFNEEVKFECVVLPKCENPVKKFPSINWGNINYDIVNTGIITGKDKATGAIVKYKCIVKPDKTGNYTASYIKL